MASNTGKGGDFLMHEKQGFRARTPLAFPDFQSAEPGLSTGLNAAPAA